MKYKFHLSGDPKKGKEDNVCSTNGQASSKADDGKTPPAAKAKKRARYSFHVKKHEEKIAKLLECRAAGLTRQQAAAVVNMSPSWVRWATVEYNIEEDWKLTPAHRRQVLLDRLASNRAYIAAVRKKLRSLSLTKQATYRVYRSKHYSSAEAFAAIGELPP